MAVGMGIDCPNVRHYGPPSMKHVQQVGRAGRDGKTSFAVLVHTKQLLSDCTEKIKYVKNTSSCRRDVLLSEFDDFSQSDINKGCACCDICTEECKCGQCKQLLSNEYSFISNMLLK